MHVEIVPVDVYVSTLDKTIKFINKLMSRQRLSSSIRAVSIRLSILVCIYIHTSPARFWSMFLPDLHDFVLVLAKPKVFVLTGQNIIAKPKQNRTGQILAPVGKQSCN